MAERAFAFREPARVTIEVSDQSSRVYFRFYGPVKQGMEALAAYLVSWTFAGGNPRIDVRLG